MPPVRKLLGNRLAGCVVAIALPLLFGAIASNASEKVLHAFKGGSDGDFPAGGLISDASGNLIGTTANGGGGTGCQGGQGCGTVFQLSPNGNEIVLHAFAGGSDGALPLGSLIADSAGNFNGTTSEGGSADEGTIFKLAPDGTATVLYAFTGGSDGGGPEGNLTKDGNGNLFGATALGGNLADCGGYGCGVVFELDSTGHESVLYAFTGGTDGLGPSGGVIRDGNGNLYGETTVGGINCGDAPSGCGVVFMLAPDGTETVLHTFQGGSDGELPRGSLLMDNAGNLYGTTVGGGGAPCNCGTVFRLAPDDTETVLYVFQDGNDGANPEAGLIRDKTGNLYGTTYAGGPSRCQHSGCGTVFKVALDGTETVLYAFKKLRYGQQPNAALLAGKDGLLYGTATAGGANNDGVVFSVTK